MTTTPQTSVSPGSRPGSAPKDETNPQSKLLESSSECLDTVTALQDAIDSYSLSLFEALRGLRDAVALDSSDASGVNNNIQALSETDGDYEDFKMSYQMGDPEAINLVGKQEFPKNREQYANMLLEAERARDEALVSRLAEEVLEKSKTVDELVSKLPGMERTKEQQMERTKFLLQDNIHAAKELESVFQEAKHIRNDVRNILQQVTCDALGIIEEK